MAAHITAASPRGPRFNENITPQGRRDPDNGIWLCQQCSRLVDADDSGHDVSDLVEWKTFAEAAAALELRGYAVRKGRDFISLQSKIPELIEEMRADIRNFPFTRKIIALSKDELYWAGDTPLFTYFLEEHDHLLSKLQICEHYGAIYDVRFNNVPRWNFTEDFAEYLLGQNV